ncbi:uracil-DNA glycosylase-like protein, partial [Gorgonomyces haynaldii]
ENKEPEQKKIKLDTDDQAENKEPLDIKTLDFKDLNLEKRTMPQDWYKALEPSMKKPYFRSLKEKLQQQLESKAVIYPAIENIYRSMDCPIKNVRVVIIGQDPYHGPNQAHGLCFSVQKGVQTPPSLVNIYKELATDIPGFKIPKHGFLLSWAAQGVLLLNASLTVRKGEPNSHAAFGWATFTDDIIKHINASRRNVVFMLWGGFAQKKGAAIDKKKHLVLKATHPSPLGANKGGWFGCKHFSQANAYLEQHGLSKINW